MADKSLTKAYMMNEVKMHAKGGPANAKHEKGESNKKKIAERRMAKKMRIKV
jgi:hypothetical protein